nr:MAG TPA: hypothetical protein [Caudoviricetes sp.]
MPKPNKNALFGRFFVPYSYCKSYLQRARKYPQKTLTQQSLKTPYF